MTAASKVVILGNTGFIGKALFEHLTHGGHRVFGYSSSVVDLRVPGSLKILESVVDRRTVMMMVAAVTPERVKADTLDTFATNLEMIVNLARFLEEHPVGKCVYLSTAAVYGSTSSNLAINENTPVAPDSYYGIAKFAGECVLQNLALHAKIPLLLLRPCRVSGPGDLYTEYGPGRFIRSILRERTLHIYGDGEELRDHLFMKDFLRLSCHLTFSESVGIYNLATGRSHSYLEIIDSLRKVIPYEFDISCLPRTRPLINQGFDISKLAAEAPDLTFTGLEEGLRETYEAHAAHLMTAS